MKVSMKLTKNFNINAIVKNVKISSHAMALHSAKIVSQHIQDEMWLQKDTQTGKIRRREGNINNTSQGDNTITGSTVDEYPNIEKATLVNGIYHQGSKVMGVAYIRASAVGVRGGDYAHRIDERNRFLNRGYNEKNLTIRNYVNNTHYLKKFI